MNSLAAIPRRRGPWGRSAWLVLLFALVAALPAIAQDAAPRVIDRGGAIHAVVEDSAEPLGADGQELPEGAGVRAGPAAVPDPEAVLAEPPPDFAVIGFGPRQVATVVTGSRLSRTMAADAPSYAAEGPVHLLMDAADDAATVAFAWNGVRLESAGGHLFYDGWATPATLHVVSGTLATAQAVAVEAAGGDVDTDTGAAGQGGAAPEAREAEAGLVLRPGDRLVLADGGPRVVRAAEGDADAEAVMPAVPTYEWSLVPGYTHPGAYKVVGTAATEAPPLVLTRYGQEVRLDRQEVPLLEGDELRAAEGQTVQADFVTEDHMRLTGPATLRVVSFVAEAEGPKSALFRFLGTLRSFLIQRKQANLVNFESPTATLGVKGTDFLAAASEAATDVSVVEGVVGVGDAQGENVVDVTAGQRTTVNAGEAPTEPGAIPPDELEGLRQGAIALEAIELESPANGAFVQEVELAFTAVPATAGVTVLLDGEPVPGAGAGTTLPNVAEGEHTVTVRGYGPESVETTVTITVDQTAPGVGEGLELAALEVLEGQPLALAFSEPVTEATLAAGDGDPQALTLAEDGMSAEVPGDASRFGLEATPVSLVLTDRAGNTAELEGQVTLVPRPDGLPTVSIGAEGVTRLVTQTVGAQPVQADRAIASWQVLLDGTDVTGELPAAAIPEEPTQRIDLPAAAFTALTPGEHRLQVRATDRFGQVGQSELPIRIDRQPPQPTLFSQRDGSVQTLGTAPVELPEGSYTIEWGEPLQALQVALNGEPQPIGSRADLEQYALRVDEATYPQNGTYRFTFQPVDQAGNRLTVTLVFTVARSGPVLRLVEPPVTSGPVRTLRPVPVVVESDMPVDAWTVRIDDRPLEGGFGRGQRLRVPPEAWPALGPGEYELTVEATRGARPPGQVQVRIMLVDRVSALREAYERTISQDTGDPLDEMYLDSRLPFWASGIPARAYGQ